MKTAKNARRRLCLLLLLPILIGIPAGCTGPGPDTETTAEEGTETEAPRTAALISGGVSLYTLVYPEESTEIERGAITAFHTAYRETTGLDIDLRADYYTSGKTDHSEDKNKILLGFTNYPASAEAFRGMKFGDWRVAVTDSYVVIAAHTAKDYETAIQWFRENILAGITGKGKNKELLMEEQQQHFSAERTFPISRLEIAGTDLSEFSIIYADRSLESAIASASEQLAKKTGCVLRAYFQREKDPSAHEILIGSTNREESGAVPSPDYLHYTAKTVGGKLVVKSGGIHSMNYILDHILTLLPASSGEITLGADYEKSGDLIDDPYEYGAPADAEMRLMSVNILAEYESWGATIPVTRRKEIFFSMLDVYRPDVIGLQEFSPAWITALRDYSRAAEWELIQCKNPNNSTASVFSLIMYRRDRFDLIESGSQYYSKYNNDKCRCCTWAVLRDKTNGKEFCFISTHWDGKDTDNTMKQVEEMTKICNSMAEKGLPVFTTGDFNSNEVSVAYQKFLADANMQDCKFAAKKMLNQIGSWHDLGIATPSYYSCDHITSTKNVTSVQFETLIDNQQIWGSDHSWLVADVKIN